MVQHTKRRGTMRSTGSDTDFLSSAGRLCRTVAIALIAGVRRGLDYDEVEARICALPVREQAVVTGATLAVLFALSLVAAQFGLIGMSLFWLAVILLVR